MNCKRCGHALPSAGYVCHFCGMMMDEEQIKKQKEIIKNQDKLRPVLISEKFGGKKQIFQEREQVPFPTKTIVFIFGIVLIILIILICGYFL